MHVQNFFFDSGNDSERGKLINNIIIGLNVKLMNKLLVIPVSILETILASYVSPCIYDAGIRVDGRDFCESLFISQVCSIWRDLSRDL